jgi:hypothetical protein
MAKKRKTDFSFGKFFNPTKSPNGSNLFNGDHYTPKHRKNQGSLIWNSKRLGEFRGSVRKDLIQHLQRLQKPTTNK